jgi:hypothetical protein
VLAVDTGNGYHLLQDVEVEEDIVGGPLGALSAGTVASTIEVEEDIDGTTPGALLAGLAVSTIEVEEDVVGGAPGGTTTWVRHRPPPMLKTSMVAHLGGCRLVQ